MGLVKLEKNPNKSEFYFLYIKTRVVTFCVVTIRVKEIVSFCAKKLLQFELKKLLHFTLMLHFAKVVKFCGITVQTLCYAELKRFFILHVRSSNCKRKVKFFTEYSWFMLNEVVCNDILKHVWSLASLHTGYIL